MKFAYAWTFAGERRGEPPAPPPGKRAPALPRLPACRALFRQTGKWIFQTGKRILRAMLALFRAGRRQPLAFGEHAVQAFQTSPPSQSGTTAAIAQGTPWKYALGSVHRTVRTALPQPACFCLLGGSKIGSDFSNSGLRSNAAYRAPGVSLCPLVLHHRRRRNVAPLGPRAVIDRGPFIAEYRQPQAPARRP